MYPSCLIQREDWTSWKHSLLSIGGKKYVPLPLLSKCVQPVAKAFMSLCNLGQWQCPRNILQYCSVLPMKNRTVHLSQTTLVDVGVAPTKRSSLTKTEPTGWPLDVLMCEIMLLWCKIHRVWLAIHMWSYLPNGFLIWEDRSTIGSATSTVMRLARNEAEINFLWSLFGAFWMVWCLCRREHLLHFCWPLCPFPLWAYCSHWNDNCFSICGQNNWAHFVETPVAFKPLNHSYQRNEFKAKLSIRA